ncbi:MAG: hypothetical protein J7M01_01515, partial [Candidatus Marinimicrobia bacterium]|nr:hypothetical protein [Candidatus Neomarinimicrobiota bacterium]
IDFVFEYIQINVLYSLYFSSRVFFFKLQFLPLSGDSFPIQHPLDFYRRTTCISRRAGMFKEKTGGCSRSG